MVRARMPYLQGHVYRRGRGVCSSPRGRGRQWQRRQNICNNQCLEFLSRRQHQPAYPLQLLSDEARKPRSLCFPSRHPPSSFAFASAPSPSLSLMSCLRSRAGGRGGGCFPVFIGLPSAAAQLSVLSEAFSLHIKTLSVYP